jgi:hypothetical protein
MPDVTPRLVPLHPPHNLVVNDAVLINIDADFCRSSLDAELVQPLVRRQNRQAPRKLQSAMLGEGDLEDGKQDLVWEGKK